MRALIVSSSPTPAGIAERIEAGLHPRIDYLELARQLRADYVDVNRFQANTPARWLEQKSRLDFRQAIWVARLVRKGGYIRVLMMSERIAIPIAHFLPKSVKQIVIEHHLLLWHRLQLVKTAKIFQKWDVIVAPTRAEASVLQTSLGQGLNQMEQVLFPVDMSFFAPGANRTPAAATDHILSLGLSKRDYPTLIEAMRRLPTIACHLRLGSAWMPERGDIDRGYLPENVAPKPFVSLLELRQCYEQCRFVVIPLQKTTQWSAGSTSALLAQTMGKPVIASKTPGMPDYVLDGETGILVEIGNPEAMADAIGYLWNKPELAEAMGRRAQEWVRATFSLDDWMGKMARIIES
ncbi:MAG: glycosyltransferase family 4 protein [Caldilineales bacterium]|nr:glycosyltransferase family 4 protein [Caldilineales bacterium]MCW5857959.1 glycosyltransferase family 4 protein [Caldilineales bacterium]